MTVLSLFRPISLCLPSQFEVPSFISFGLGVAGRTARDTTSPLASVICMIGCVKSEANHGPSPQIIGDHLAAVAPHVTRHNSSQLLGDSEVGRGPKTSVAPPHPPSVTGSPPGKNHIMLEEYTGSVNETPPWKKRGD